MLEKIVEIKNVGVFEDYSAPGSARFSDATLIFAGNGRGKTTISAILRSLSDDDVDLRGRERLGAEGDCSVFVRSDSANHRYAPHAWDKPFRRIDVFDEEFIHSNVHSAYFVDREHKRSLYRVVVGTKGTRLAEMVEEIDEEITEINNQLREQREKLIQKAEGDLAVDDFVALSEVEDVDEMIEATRAELSLAEREQEIKKENGLDKVTAPEIPDELGQLLERTLEDVSQSAVDHVQNHIEDRLGPNGEPWVQEGLGYVKEEQCPFCDQGLEGVELVEAYRDYFSDKYRALQEKMASAAREIDEELSDESLQRLREGLEDCQERLEFWKPIAEIDVKIPEPNAVIPDLRRLRSALVARLEQKQKAPLEKIELGTQAERALDSYHSVAEKLEQLNATVDSANDTIEDKKKDLAGANPQKLRSKIERLQNSKIRHSKAVSELVDQYERTKKSKEETKGLKERTKDKLDEHAEQIFPTYQTRINWHLERCGADFRICEVKPNYVGRQPNSDYALQINDEVVQLGSDEPTDHPSFRNTLSAGDKSALALAFFLARLDLEDDLEDRVVVFDDPIASFDSGRQNYTRNQIARVISKARQGIVMSHDPYFLVRLHRRLVNVQEGSIGTLKIRKSSRGSELVEWNIERDAKTDFFKNYSLMRDFREGISGVKKKEAIRAIRPALEHNLRSRFPGSFSSGQNLGRYLAQIREADEADEIGVLKNDYDLLDDLDSYTAPYHHASSAAETPPRIDATELKNNIDLTLRFMRGMD